MCSCPIRAAICQVVLFQETRRKFTDPFRVTFEDTLLMIQSPGTPEGRCGCAVGIDAKGTLGQIGAKAGVTTNASAMATVRKARKFAVTADDISVLHADARILAVTFNLSGRLIGLVSLPAPDTSKGAVTSEWWYKASAVLRRFPVDVVP